LQYPYQYLSRHCYLHHHRRHHHHHLSWTTMGWLMQVLQQLAQVLEQAQVLGREQEKVLGPEQKVLEQVQAQVLEQVQVLVLVQEKAQPFVIL
jgi:hypothetical protein